MAVGDLYRLAVTSLGLPAGNEIVNVFHYRQTNNDPSISVTNDLAEVWWDQVGSAYRACFHSSISVIRLTVGLMPTGVAVGELFPTSSNAGTVSGNANPTQSSCLISFRTSVPGRRFRGRCYLPYAGAGVMNTEGEYNVTYTGTTAVDFADALLTPVADSEGSGEYELVVWSGVEVAGQTVNAYVVNRNPATQRSRRT